MFGIKGMDCILVRKQLNTESKSWVSNGRHLKAGQVNSGFWMFLVFQLFSFWIPAVGVHAKSIMKFFLNFYLGLVHFRFLPSLLQPDDPDLRSGEPEQG